MRVILADRLSDFVVRRLEDAGMAVTSGAALSGDALHEALARQDPEVLVVRSTRVERRHLEAAPSLALIVRAGAGVNTIDVEAAAARAVHVAACPGRNAVAVAELTLGHLINLDRRISDHVAALREGRWTKGAFGDGRGLKGRTLAVVGCGAIGGEVIRRALAFGMRVRAWSRSLSQEDAQALGVERAATLLAACRGADALTVHVALTPQTRGLIGREQLEALRPGAYVINTARGGVIDEQALLEAIGTRGLRAALDVYEEEPAADAERFDDARITGEAAIYGTPHIAASTEQAADAVAEDVVRIVVGFQRTGEVRGAVNLSARTAASHVLLVRHVDAVGVLARVLGCLSEAGLNVEEMGNEVFDGCRAAVARIQVSQRPSGAVVARLQGIAEVFSVGVVELEGGVEGRRG